MGLYIGINGFGAVSQLPPPPHYRSFPEIIEPASDTEQAETSPANYKNNPVDSMRHVLLLVTLIYHL